MGGGGGGGDPEQVQEVVQTLSAIDPDYGKAALAAIALEAAERGLIPPQEAAVATSEAARREAPREEASHGR